MSELGAKWFWWEECGYIAGACVNEETDTWVCVAPMLFTYRLMICTPAPLGGVQEFWCYEQAADALKAFDAFVEAGAKGDPLPGWTKHHPRGGA